MHTLCIATVVVSNRVSIQCIVCIVRARREWYVVYMHVHAYARTLATLVVLQTSVCILPTSTLLEHHGQDISIYES